MNEYKQDVDQISSELYQTETLPKGLNVLTILTYIWSAIVFLSSIYSFFSAKKNYDNKDKVLEQINNPDVPKFVKQLMPDAANFEQLTLNSYQNKVPILILSLVATGLCFYGAVEMRKRKKQGYSFYLIGSFLPYFTSIFFIGLFTLTSYVAIFFILINLLFVYLYFRQRKHLIY